MGGADLTATAEADWTRISVNTHSQGRARFAVGDKTAIICSKDQGFCVGREGTSNYCYGSNKACASPLNNRQCVVNSDCANFNVVGAPRWTHADFNNCASATLEPWAKELCTWNDKRVEARKHCDDEKGCELFKRTLKLADLPDTLET